MGKACRKVLITGHTGFVGSNLSKFLKDKYKDSIEIIGYNSSNTIEDLHDKLMECDFVYDLAAVHRPKNEEDFTSVNVGLLDEICKTLEEHERKVPVLYTSSIQCGNGSLYGKSKMEGENRVLKYSETTGNRAYVYRLTNTYGPGARPNGHSVVATFCYNLARDIPIRVDNRESMIKFCYVGDVIEQIVELMEDESGVKSGIHDVPENCTYSISVGELADMLTRFKEVVAVGDDVVINNEFEQNMYNTYVSYLT